MSDADVNEADSLTTTLDFEAWLDQYLATLGTRDRATVQNDLEWFRAFYFDHNDDARRLKALQAYATGGPPADY